MTRDGVVLLHGIGSSSDSWIRQLDGLAEQQNSNGDEFGLERILAALANSTGPDRDVAALFDALLNFAVPPEAASYPDHIALADDVTIVSAVMN